MTPIEYLNSCRVEAASHLLLNQPDLSITQVAYACGFNSSQYFATAFQVFKGCTPSKFRTQ